MQQEVVLAMLAKEPSHGYQLRARLRDALGPLGGALTGSLHRAPGPGLARGRGGGNLPLQRHRGRATGGNDKI